VIEISGVQLPRELPNSTLRAQVAVAPGGVNVSIVVIRGGARRTFHARWED